MPSLYAASPLLPVVFLSPSLTSCTVLVFGATCACPSTVVAVLTASDEAASRRNLPAQPAPSPPLLPLFARFGPNVEFA
ncbi:hypothetical protein PR003_g31138 [Phytophthora rubi]|uniref:Uncharacterized protein n=1 Tax=Phytophthora rubi TaxID=129364 RepID=A0A6A4B847_9STRA|nr:hypothetical protein PR003_g31138 [Phytophthora rubi]